MYRLVIVDDEEIVREGIEHTIEWSKLGFEFAGSFDNGTDAAVAVDELHPAVVITDICMPFGDGLDLTQRILEAHPQTKVILLTGFDEFEYAQRAVRLGARDYILKPITAAELRALLVHLKSELDEEAQRERERNAESRESAAAHETRIRLLTEAIANGRASRRRRQAEQLVEELYQSGTVPPSRGVVLVAGPECQEDAGPEVAETLGRLIRDCGCYTFTDHEDRQVAVVAGRTSDDAADRARGIATSLLEEARSRLGRPATVGLGRPFRSPQELPRSYGEAARCFEYRFIAGGGRVIDSSALPRRQTAASSQGEWSKRFAATVSELARALRACDAVQVEETVGSLIRAAADRYVSRERCMLHVHTVLVAINEVRAEVGDPPVAIDAFSGASSLDAVSRRLLAVCRSVVASQVRSRRTYRGSKAEEAIAYIRRHHASPSLSLGSLCGAIAVSPSYFSSLFKAKTGKTFIAYLTEVRIDHAKRLLGTTDLKSYEVAERVGYEDEHYFSTIFKRATGRSPTQFRREATAARIPAHE